MGFGSMPNPQPGRARVFCQGDLLFAAISRGNFSRGRRIPARLCCCHSTAVELDYQGCYGLYTAANFCQHLRSTPCSPRALYWDPLPPFNPNIFKRNRKHVLRVSIELYKHEWKFGRTRNAV